MRMPLQAAWGVASGDRPRRGVTLLEVLVAIFIMGVGMLALLALFPVGALELAQAIKDDRASQVAADAAIFSKDGAQVVGQTRTYVTKTLFTWKVDAQQAGKLRSDCEKLSERASDLEERLRALRPLINDPATHHLLDVRLVEIKTIRLSFDVLASLLRILEDKQWS